MWKKIWQKRCSPAWQHVIRNKTTPDLSLKFYVIAVAQNRWNKRKKKKTKKAGSETPTEQQLIQHSELVAALKQLTDGERKLLYFFYFDGYSAKEIASLLGLTGPEEMRMEKSRSTY
jgi:DNA-directed RNA polymerase specialized sigma24 family protein